MVAMTAIDAQKLVSSTISPVPFETMPTKLRSFPRIFAYYLNPHLFTFSLQQSLRVPIKPMRQPPVKSARKRSSCTRFNLFQIFYHHGFDLRKVYLFQSVPNHRFNFCLGMLWNNETFLKSLPWLTSAYRKYCPWLL